MIILKNIPLYALSNFIRHCNEQLWKNIAEIKSFLWVVLAFEKWVPKSEKSVVICDVILCGDASK